MKVIQEIVTIIIAIAIIIGFGCFINVLLQHLSDSETEWTRLAFIYGGVEAAGFAAIGFFFGKEVNRKHADVAEERSKEAEIKAQKEIDQRSMFQTKLSDLVNQIKVMRTSSPDDSKLVQLAEFADRIA